MSPFPEKIFYIRNKGFYLDIETTKNLILYDSPNISDKNSPIQFHKPNQIPIP